MRTRVKLLVCGLSSAGGFLSCPVRATPPCAVTWETAAPVPTSAAEGVPVNVQIFSFDDVDVERVDVLVRGEPVAFSSHQLEASRGFQRIVPDDDLEIDDEVELHLNGASVTSFVVRAARDDEPPAKPSAEDRGAFTDGACGPLAEIGVEGDAAFFIAKIDADPTLDDGEQLNGVSRAERLSITGPADTDVDVHVAAVDLAGNISEAAVVRAHIPAEGLLPYPWCGQHRAGETSWPFGVLALFPLIRATRRR